MLRKGHKNPGKMLQRAVKNLGKMLRKMWQENVQKNVTKIGCKEKGNGADPLPFLMTS